MNSLPHIFPLIAAGANINSVFGEHSFFRLSCGPLHPFSRLTQPERDFVLSFGAIQALEYFPSNLRHGSPVRPEYR